MNLSEFIYNELTKIIEEIKLKKRIVYFWVEWPSINNMQQVLITKISEARYIICKYNSILTKFKSIKSELIL